MAVVCRRKGSLAFLGSVLLLAAGAWASGEDIITTADPDSLFDEVGAVEEPVETETDPGDGLLASERVEWGGSFRGSVSADWLWSDPWNHSELLDPTSQFLTPKLAADLFFDARPDPEFRVFGKLKIQTTADGSFDLGGLSPFQQPVDASILPAGWTAQVKENGDIEIRDANGILIVTIPAEGAAVIEEIEPETGVTPGLAISTFELFADYSFEDALFFRFGKHTIHWGVGYFFSPADVLNLTSIDPEDPTIDRPGPVSLRVHFPFGLTGNARLYLIVNDQVEPLDVAVAPKVEFVAGPGELGIGAYFQRELAPRLAAFYSVSWGDVDLFSEAVLLYGSDRVFVRSSGDQSAAESDPNDGLDLVLDTYTVDKALYGLATVGARYVRKWQDVLSLLVVGQYYFNGEGYGDDVEGLLPAASRLLLFPGENGLALDPAERPANYQAPPGLGLADLSQWGRHYIAATVGASELLATDLGVQLFWMMNLSDLSGVVVPSLSYSFLERFSTSLSVRFTFGDGNDELTDPASLFRGIQPHPTVGVTLTVTMPGGPF